MVSAVSSKTCNGTPCSIFAGLDLGSKYHGYSDSSAPAALNYTLAYAVDLSDKGVPPPGWYHNNGSKYPLKCVNGDDHHFNYAALFSPTFTAYYNIRDSQGNLLSLAQLIQSGLVHEVFLYIWGNDSLPDQFNACTSDAQCSVGRVCRDSVGNPCPPSSGCYCRTSDAYQCPSGGPFLPNFGLPEVLEWKPTYDATSHKVRDQNGNPIFSGAASNGAFDQDELPTLQTVGHSIRILNVAATRGPGCAIHSLGHGFEHTRSVVPELNPNFLHFANFDLNGRGFSPTPPFGSWYACTDNCVVFAAPNILNWTYPPTGQTGSMNPYNQGCGSVHFPPNARHAYDETNGYQVLSSCENFGLHNGTGGQDALQLISNSKWASLSPAQGVVYNNVAPDCEGGWQIYWRQSFPGYHNAATGRTSSGTSDGVPIKNWWPYLFY